MRSFLSCLLVISAIFSGHMLSACDNAVNVDCSMAIELSPGISNMSCLNACLPTQPLDNYSTSLLDLNIPPYGASWFKMTTPAQRHFLDASVSGTDTESLIVNVYIGDCSNLSLIQSFSGSDVLLDLQEFRLQADLEYYISVASKKSTGGEFDICVSYIEDTSICNTEFNLEVVNTSLGSPLSGPFLPFEEVEICYQVTGYNNQGCNYLHGIVPTFGAGWAASSFDASGSPVNISVPLETQGRTTFTPSDPVCHDELAGEWLWYESGIKYNLNSENPLGLRFGEEVPPGWFFLNSFDPDCFDYTEDGCCTNPTNDPNLGFGDDNYPLCRGGDVQNWKVCFILTTADINSCASSTDCSVSVKSVSDGETGTVTSIGCKFDAFSRLNLAVDCCRKPNISVLDNVSICQNEPLELEVNTSSSDADIFIIGPNGALIQYTDDTDWNMYFDFSQIGRVTLEAFISNGCISAIETIEVEISESDVTPEFSYQQNMCANEDSFVLNSISDNGVVGTWSSNLVVPENHAGGGIRLIFRPDNSCIPEITQEFNFQELPDIEVLDNFQACHGGTIVLSDLYMGTLEPTDIVTLHMTQSSDDTDIIQGGQIENFSTNQQLFIKVANDICEEIFPIQIEVAIEILNESDLVICQTGTDSQVSLSSLEESIGSMNGVILYNSVDDAMNGNNPIDQDFAISQNATVYGFYRGSGDCNVITPVNIELRDSPVTSLEIQSDQLTLNCLDSLAQLTSSYIDINNEYSWLDQDGQIIGTDETIDVTQAGIYSLTLKDGFSGCELTALAVTVQNDMTLPDFEIIADQGIMLSCSVSEIPLSVNADLSEYNVEWNLANQTIDGDNVQANTEGEVVVTITNIINGCSQDLAVEISAEVDLPDFEIDDIDPLTCSQTNSEVNLSIMNPELYVFNWFDANMDALDIDGSSQQIITESGNYFVEVQNQNTGCKAVKEFLVTDQSAFPELSFVGDTFLSCDNGTAVVVADSNFDQQDVEVEWVAASDGNFLSNEFEMTFNTAGQYDITVIHMATGCKTTESIVVEENPFVLDDVIIISENPRCENQLTGSISVDESSVTGENIQYSLDNIEFQTASEFRDLSSGDYTVYVKNDQGCQFESPVTLNTSSNLSFYIEQGEQVQVIVGESLDLDVFLEFDESEVIMVTWFYDGGISCTDCLSTVVTPEKTTIYTVEIEHIDGCVESKSIEVIVDNDLPLYIPNIIDPRSNDINNKFMISGPGLNWIRSFQVYDRWGNTIFSEEEYDPLDETKAFRGIYKDQILDNGVYIYNIVYLLNDGTEERLTGNITIFQ